MADSFRKLPIGSPITAFSITAWNRMIDMLNWWQQQGHTGGGPLKNLIDWDQTVFRAKNNTGGDLASYDVVGLDGPLYTAAESFEEFANRTTQKVVAPTVADHAEGRWGVMIEAAASGAIGRCCLSGVVPIRVYVAATSDTHCEISEAKTVSGETVRVSTGQTGARILNLDPNATAGTIAWALVRLGSGGGTPSTTATYQLIGRMDEHYTALANPATYQPATGKHLDLDEGEITENTRVIIDTSQQQCGWIGDLVEVEPVALDMTGYTDPNANATTALLLAESITPIYYQMLSRRRSKLKFRGALGSSQLDWTDNAGFGATALIDCNPGGDTVYRTVHVESGSLIAGQVVSAYTPILVRFDPDDRNYYVIMAPCASVS